MDFNFSKESLELQDKLKTFFVDHIYPNEDHYENAIIDSGDPLHIPEILSELKSKAKKENLWNLFLPDNEYGYGLSNVDYAPLAEITGHNWWAPEVFNCSAPDTVNMEILAEFGTSEQKKQWLEPLLEGEIRSSFAMTEPNVASSDATNIGSSIVSDGDNYVINGRKWWTSNAINQNANNKTGRTSGYRPPNNKKNKNWGGGQALGGNNSNIGGKSPEQIRAAAVEAAEQRRQTNTKGIDSNRHKREALVGKILSYYASAGKDPPIGLSASQDITALKKHLEHAKNLK